MRSRHLVSSIMLTTTLAASAILQSVMVSRPANIVADHASDNMHQPGDAVIVVENATVRIPKQLSEEITSPHAPQAAFPMYEPFVAPWPLPATGWTVTGTTHKWGRRSCYPRSDSYSMWSHGGGTQGASLACFANYPNSMTTYAVYGPVDLTNVPKPKLSFYIWGRIEAAPDCPTDAFSTMSSVDGSNFSGIKRCGDFRDGGNINGYTPITFDLSNRAGQSQVWILFGFESNSSVSDMGLFVDNIAFENDNSPPVTITPTNTPTATPTPTSSGYIISGIVRDPSGFPTANANIDAIPMGSGQYRGTQTDANGSYVVIVVAGTYIIQASKNGYYADQEFNVSVPPSQSGVNLDLGVLPGSPITTTTPTPTPTITPFPCPTLTPEPFQVEPLTSPTNQESQIVTVRIGNGAAVSITTVSGVFTATGNFSFNNPAQITVMLLPRTTHHLSVQARTAQVNGCGGYTLGTSVDKNGQSLVIVRQPEQYLPLVSNQPVRTPVPTPTVTPTSVPPSGSNRPPRFSLPMSVQHLTQYEYDNVGRLKGATTSITVEPAVDPDGDSVSYSWTATTGWIDGSSTSASWARVISYGAVQPGSVTVKAEDGRGGSDTFTINFY